MQTTISLVYQFIRDLFKDTVDEPLMVRRENQTFEYSNLVSIVKVAGPYALIVLSIILSQQEEEVSYYSIFLFVIFGAIFFTFREKQFFLRIIAVVVLLYFLGVFAYNRSSTSNRIREEIAIPQIKYSQVFSLGASTTLPQAIQFALEKKKSGFKDIKIVFYKRQTYRVIVDTTVLTDLIRKNPYGYEVLLLESITYKDKDNETGIEIFESN